ncbi:MAG: hypothetical protein EXS13_08400 [Planctomycetes bacterium]|nr:hypothetical protein [Planctomycetota bacterium]
MTFVCATHPAVEAIARCVRCGLHLCPSCRALDGVRNFCVSCRSTLHPEPAVFVTAAGAAVAVPVDGVAPRAHARSRWLAAALSIVPGLGQAYTGRVMRGAGLFGAALMLRDAPFMTPLLGAYLYVFGLFDAFRCAETGKGVAVSTGGARADDVLFLLIGLGVIAITLTTHGGFAAAPRELLVPLGGIAASLLLAHETRR